MRDFEYHHAYGRRHSGLATRKMRFRRIRVACHRKQRVLVLVALVSRRGDRCAVQSRRRVVAVVVEVGVALGNARGIIRTRSRSCFCAQISG